MAGKVGRLGWTVQGIARLAPTQVSPDARLTRSNLCMPFARLKGQTRLLRTCTSSLVAEAASCALPHLCAVRVIPQPDVKLLFEHSSLLHLVGSGYSTAAFDTERTGKGHYVDRLRVELQAGRGGSGCVAFWKSAAKGTLHSFALRRAMIAEHVGLAWCCRQVPAC